MQVQSILFERPLKSIDSPDSLIVSIHGKMSISQDFSLVYEVRNSDGTKNSLRQTFVPRKEEQWEAHQFILEVPQSEDPEAELAVFVWMSNKAGNRAYFDNMNIRFK